MVVPTNVVKNWGEEFEKWLPSKDDPDHTWSKLRRGSGRRIISVGGLAGPNHPSLGWFGCMGGWRGWQRRRWMHLLDLAVGMLVCKLVLSCSGERAVAW